MIIHVDTEKCSGYGNCVFAAPSVFDLDMTTNLAVVKKPVLTEDDRREVLDAVADCPASAIAVDRP